MAGRQVRGRGGGGGWRVPAWRGGRHVLAAQQGPTAHTTRPPTVLTAKVRSHQKHQTACSSALLLRLRTMAASRLFGGEGAWRRRGGGGGGGGSPAPNPARCTAGARTAAIVQRACIWLAGRQGTGKVADAEGEQRVLALAPVHEPGAAADQQELEHSPTEQAVSGGRVLLTSCGGRRPCGLTSNSRPPVARSRYRLCPASTN